MNKLDKIIDEYAHEHHSLLKTKLKELFEDLIDEVIGPEYLISEDDRPMAVAELKLANEQMALQRQIAKELLKEL